MSETTAMSKTAAQHTEQLIWLGAGSATEPAGLIANANQVLLVEARKAACQQLTAQFSANSKVSVKQAVISLDGGEVNFTEYNLAEFSALSPLTGLTELFPGLTAVKSRPQPSLTLSELLTPLALSGNNNTLVLDIADLNLALLKQLQASGQLEKFNQLYLQGSSIALYQGAATLTQLNSWLAQQGFLLQTQDNTDPDLPWLQFGVNPLWQPLQQAQQQHRAEQAKAGQAQAELTKQLNAVKQQVVENNAQHQQQLLEQKRQFEQKLAQLTQQLAQRVSENETLQQQQAAAKVAAEKSQAELQGRLAGMDAELQQALKQRQTAEQQIHSLNETLEQQAQHLAKLQQQLAQATQHNTQLNADNAALTAQSQVYQQWQAAQSQQLDAVQQKMVTELNKSLSNSVKQMEAFIGLRDLLGFGQMPLNYHGWPISADIGLYLAKKVVSEPFDYIIEFGSGTSTVVFARALHTREKQGANDNGCKVVSFEHNKTYLQKTAADIAAHQVEDRVDLVYAPLVELQCDDSSYLFYSCDDKLAEISQQLQGKEGRILVLVDGPPASTGPLARYPAIPQILKYLARHQLHIVMDDYVREDEKKAAAKWSKLFEERGIKHHKELLNFEKVGFSWILNH